MTQSSARVDARRGISARVVALTFDDGPSPWTGPIASHLERHGGRGTFFVIGEAIDERGEEIVRRLAGAGHEIGNHTWSHPDLRWLTDDEIRDELSRTNARLAGIVDETPHYWRPPFLRSDERVREAIGDLVGREVWYSEPMAEDWEQPAREIATRVLVAMQPGDIVVLTTAGPRTSRPSSPGRPARRRSRRSA